MFTVIIQGENESGFFLHLHHIFFLYQYDFIILRFDDFKLSEKKPTQTFKQILHKPKHRQTDKWKTDKLTNRWPY